MSLIDKRFLRFWKESLLTLDRRFPEIDRIPRYYFPWPSISDKTLISAMRTLAGCVRLPVPGPVFISGFEVIPDNVTNHIEPLEDELRTPSLQIFLWREIQKANAGTCYVVKQLAGDFGDVSGIRDNQEGYWLLERFDRNDKCHWLAQEIEAKWRGSLYETMDFVGHSVTWPENIHFGDAGRSAWLIIGQLLNKIMPCGYELRAQPSNPCGTSSQRRRDVCSFLTYQKAERLYVAYEEFHGPHVIHPHKRDGHVRYPWKAHGVDRFTLPRNFWERFTIATNLGIEPIYVNPCWVGPRRFGSDGFDFEITQAPSGGCDGVDEQ